MRKMEIKRLKQEASQLPAEQRRGAISDLLSAAQNRDDRDEALLACIDLCHDRSIIKDALTPHSQTILAFWSEYVHTVLPLQKDPHKLDWIIPENGYSSVRRSGGILLDLMGYLPMDLAENSLREVLSLTDPHLKMFAALSMLRNLKHVEPTDLDAIGASHETRLLFWEQLETLEMQSLMPSLWAMPQMLAASDLSRWAGSPFELSVPPEEIEWMATFPVNIDAKEEEIYLFRFREFPKPWEPDEGWFAGIAGPYRGGKPLRAPWSRFESWNSKSPKEHFLVLIGAS
ncbi:MAG: hypothetical protein WCA10_10025 [Terracidiphilus sp.]